MFLGFLRCGFLISVVLARAASLTLLIQHLVDGGAFGSRAVLFGGGATRLWFEEFLACFGVIQVVAEVLGMGQTCLRSFA